MRPGADEGPAATGGDGRLVIAATYARRDGYQGFNEREVFGTTDPGAHRGGGRPFLPGEARQRGRPLRVLRHQRLRRSRGVSQRWPRRRREGPPRRRRHPAPRRRARRPAAPGGRRVPGAGADPRGGAARRRHRRRRRTPRPRRLGGRARAGGAAQGGRRPGPATRAQPGARRRPRPQDGSAGAPAALGAATRPALRLRRLRGRRRLDRRARRGGALAARRGGRREPRRRPHGLARRAPALPGWRARRNLGLGQPQSGRRAGRRPGRPPTRSSPTTPSMAWSVCRPWKRRSPSSPTTRRHGVSSSAAASAASCTRPSSPPPPTALAASTRTISRRWGLGRRARRLRRSRPAASARCSPFAARRCSASNLGRSLLLRHPRRLRLSLRPPGTTRRSGRHTIRETPSGVSGAQGNRLTAQEYGMTDDVPSEDRVTVTLEERDGRTRMTMCRGTPRDVAGRGGTESAR